MRCYLFLSLSHSFYVRIFPYFSLSFTRFLCLSLAPRHGPSKCISVSLSRLFLSRSFGLKLGIETEKKGERLADRRLMVLLSILSLVLAFPLFSSTRSLLRRLLIDSCSDSSPFLPFLLASSAATRVLQFITRTREHAGTHSPAHPHTRAAAHSRAVMKS